MKTIQTTLIRHLVTGLAGIGTYLLTVGLIEPGAVDAANAHGAALVEPLAGILSLVAVVAVRLAIAWIGRFFPAIAEKASGGMSGGAYLWLVGMTAAAVGGSLPSCSPAQVEAWRQVPVQTCVLTDQGKVCYSSKAGLSAEVDARSSK